MDDASHAPASWLSALADWLAGQSPVQLAEHAIVLVAAGYSLNRLRKCLSIEAVLNNKFTKALLQSKLEQEASQAVAGMFPPETMNTMAMRSIPRDGIAYQHLLDLMRRLKEFDADGSSGRSFAYVYDTTLVGHNEFVQQAQNLFLHENALNPVAFPALRRFEVEVVRMTATLFHGDESVVGTMTSGGTESILCAIKAYRDRARELHPEITEPEMVLPITAHVGFEKAGHYFNVKRVYVPIDPVSMKVTVEAMRAAITKNTIVLVASAPQYPHGVLDPIAELGELALAHQLPFHVDACVGGFILPWIEKLGYEVPAWDFRVAGVTSISADIHKYGYCPKGASTLTYRNASYRKYQFMAYAGWPGGLFVSPSMLGSRAGGAIAAAWAALCGLGEEGYLSTARLVMDAAKCMRAGIESIPELKLLGDPRACILSFASANKQLNIFAVADVMQDTHGWKVERQHRPDSIHLSVMPPHAKIAEQFVVDLKASVEVVKANPALADKGSAAMYGNAAAIPSDAVVEDFLVSFMDHVYRADAAATTSTSTSTSTTSSSTTASTSE